MLESYGAFKQYITHCTHFKAHLPVKENIEKKEGFEYYDHNGLESFLDLVLKFEE